MKLKLIALITGFILVLFSYFAHGAFGAVDLTISPSQFELQQGSERDLMLNYFVNSNKGVKTLTQVKEFDKVKLDFGFKGHESMLSTSYSFPGRVKVERDVPSGEYELKLSVLNLETNNVLDSETIKVKVVEKGEKNYFTSPGKTIEPRIENIKFSENNVLLKRNDSKEVKIDFENAGSLSNFRVKIVNSSKEVEGIASSNEFENLSKGTASIKLVSNPIAKEGSHEVKVLLVDLASYKEHLLGTINVIVKPFYNLQTSVELNSTEAKIGETVKGKLVIKNLSAFDQTLSLNGTPEMEFESQKIELAGNQLKSIEFKVKPFKEGENGFTINLNGETNRIVFIKVKGLKAGISSTEDIVKAFEGSNIALIGLVEPSWPIVLGILIAILLYALWKKEQVMNLIQRILGNLLDEFVLSPAFSTQSLKQESKEVKEEIEETSEKEVEKDSSEEKKTENIEAREEKESEKELEEIVSKEIEIKQLIEELEEKITEEKQKKLNEFK